MMGWKRISQMVITFGFFIVIRAPALTNPSLRSVSPRGELIEAGSVIVIKSLEAIPDQLQLAFLMTFSSFLTASLTISWIGRLSCFM